MLQESDNKLIARALTYWANWIETRDISKSALSAEVSDKQEQIIKLGQEQKQFVEKLRELAVKSIRADGDGELPIYMRGSSK